jgi:hypothetical protein
MTIRDAKKLGGGHTLRAAFYIFILYEIWLLFDQTQGDFANGILFFFAIQLNPYFIGFIVFYFVSMFLLGQRSGYSLLIKKRDPSKIAIIYALSATTVTLALFLLIIFLPNRNELFISKRNGIAKAVILGFLLLLVPMTIAWFWIINRLKKS